MTAGGQSRSARTFPAQRDPARNELGARARPASWVAAGPLTRAGLGTVTVAAIAALAVAVRGWAPHPAVSPAGSRALIALNGSLRTAGPASLACLALLVLAGALLRRHSAAFDAQLRGGRPRKPLRAATILLLTMLVGTVAAGSGLGVAASSGALQPVSLLARATTGPDSEKSVLLQQAHALPFDHSEIATADVIRLQHLVERRGGRVLPFDLLLGDLRRPGQSQNPSSSAIVAAPVAALAGFTGVSAPRWRSASCSAIPTVVGTQLGAPRGSSVSVEGHRAVVVGLIRAYPGLDRSIAIIPLGTAQRCLTAANYVTGALVGGIPWREVSGLISARSLRGLATIPWPTMLARYRSFWAHSVEPPVMEFVLYLWLVSIVGLAAIRLVGVYGRRQFLAVHIAAGVPRHRLSLGEACSSVVDLFYAVGLAAILTLVLIDLNNSSQFGLAEHYDLHALGAGTAVGLIAAAVSALVTYFFMQRMRTTVVDRE